MNSVPGVAEVPVASHPDPGELLARLYSAAESERRANRIERASADIAGMIAGGRERPEPFSIDPLPLILGEEEWGCLQDGVRQRCRMLTRFLRDLYGPRQLIHDGVVSPLILSNPAFLRAMSGLYGESEPVLLMAFDLMRHEDGTWIFVQNHLGFPEGLAMATVVRRAMAQAYPEMFSRYAVEPVAEFAGRWIEAMRSASGQLFPRVVLLSEGGPGSSFEEGFVARQMGISVVTPVDLVVRDHEVWMKTVSGLEKVDLIVRSIASSRIDPVAQQQDGFAGLPGLIHCVRRGSVRVLSLPGSEVADDLRLLAFHSRLTPYYLNEGALLPTLRTFDAVDPDQAEWMADEMAGISLREAVRRSPVTDAEFPAFDPPWFAAEQFVEESLGQPVVGYRRFPMQQFPRAWGGSSPVLLRLFVLGGPQPMVLPGGVCRLVEERPDGTFGYAGAVKDVWVLESALTDSIVLRNKLEPELNVGATSTTSRVAESMYWAARYTERAGATAFRLRLLESIQWSELSPAEAEVYWPLWKSTSAAAGNERIRRLRKMPADLAALSYRLLASSEEPSIRQALASGQYNLQMVSDYVTPEVLRAMSGMQRILEGEGMDPAAVSILERAEALSDGYSQFLGTMYRSMARDAGMSFFRIGIAVERIYGLVAFLDCMLPVTLPLARRHLDDDTDLTAVLRLLGTLDLYRREYRSRAFLDRLLRLLWQHPAAPVSFRSNLENLEREFRLLAELTKREGTEESLRVVTELRERVIGVDFGKLFPERRQDLDAAELMSLAIPRKSLSGIRRELAAISKGVSSLHSAIEDTFFNHLR